MGNSGSKGGKSNKHHGGGQATGYKPQVLQWLCCTRMRCRARARGRRGARAPEACSICHLPQFTVRSPNLRRRHPGRRSTRPQPSMRMPVRRPRARAASRTPLGRALRSRHSSASAEAVTPSGRGGLARAGCWQGARSTASAPCPLLDDRLLPRRGRTSIRQSSLCRWQKLMGCSQPSQTRRWRCSSRRWSS